VLADGVRAAPPASSWSRCCPHTPYPERLMDVATPSCTLHDDDALMPVGAAALSRAARGGGLTVFKAGVLQ
jgi:hypothetical protein